MISHCIASENIFRSGKAVDRPIEGKRLDIYWISHHTGFMGNEIADEIAKNVIHLTIAPEQNIQKSLKTIYEYNKSSQRVPDWCEVDLISDMKNNPFICLHGRVYYRKFINNLRWYLTLLVRKSTKNVSQSFQSKNL